MAWNLDDDGKFKNPISGHSATTFFLRRSIAIIREITGMELDYPEFGISCLNTTGIIAQHWDFIPSAKSHPDTVINLCVVMESWSGLTQHAKIALRAFRLPTQLIRKKLKICFLWLCSLFMNYFLHSSSFLKLSLLWKARLIMQFAMWKN